MLPPQASSTPKPSKPNVEQDSDQNSDYSNESIDYKSTSTSTMDELMDTMSDMDGTSDGMYKMVWGSLGYKLDILPMKPCLG